MADLLHIHQLWHIFKGPPCLLQLRNLRSVLRWCCKSNVRGSSLKQCQGRFRYWRLFRFWRFGYWEHSFIKRVVRLPRAVVESPSLWEFKATWMWHLGHGSVLALAVLGNSWTWSERAFPILKTPWFYIDGKCIEILSKRSPGAHCFQGNLDFSRLFVVSQVLYSVCAADPTGACISQTTPLSVILIKHYFSVLNR